MTRVFLGFGETGFGELEFGEMGHNQSTLWELSFQAESHFLTAVTLKATRSLGPGYN